MVVRVVNSFGFAQPDASVQVHSLGVPSTARGEESNPTQPECQLDELGPLAGFSDSAGIVTITFIVLKASLRAPCLFEVFTLDAEGYRSSALFRTEAVPLVKRWTSVFYPRLTPQC